MRLASNFGNHWCSLEEETFLELLHKELTGFSNRAKLNRVLVFPPFSPHFRFLTHKIVEVHSKLSSVSLGREPNRRTVVYFEETSFHRGDQSMNSNKEPNSGSTSYNSSAGKGRGRGRGRGRGLALGDDISKSNQNPVSSTTSSPARTRRPPRVLYQPGAFRNRMKGKPDGKEVKQPTPVQSPCAVKVDTKWTAEVRVPSPNRTQGKSWNNRTMGANGKISGISGGIGSNGKASFSGKVGICEEMGVNGKIRDNGGISSSSRKVGDSSESEGMSYIGGLGYSWEIGTSRGIGNNGGKGVNKEKPGSGEFGDNGEMFGNGEKGVSGEMGNSREMGDSREVGDVEKMGDSSKTVDIKGMGHSGEMGDKDEMGNSREMSGCWEMGDNGEMLDGGEIGTGDEPYACEAHGMVNYFADDRKKGTLPSEDVIDTRKEKDPVKNGLVQINPSGSGKEGSIHDSHLISHPYTSKEKDFINPAEAVTSQDPGIQSGTEGDADVSGIATSCAVIDTTHLTTCTQSQDLTGFGSFPRTQGKNNDFTVNVSDHHGAQVDSGNFSGDTGTQMVDPTHNINVPLNGDLTAHSHSQSDHVNSSDLSGMCKAITDSSNCPSGDSSGNTGSRMLDPNHNVNVPLNGDLITHSHSQSDHINSSSLSGRSKAITDPSSGDSSDDTDTQMVGPIDDTNVYPVLDKTNLSSTCDVMVYPSDHSITKMGKCNHGVNTGTQLVDSVDNVNDCLRPGVVNSHTSVPDMTETLEIADKHMIHSSGFLIAERDTICNVPTQDIGDGLCHFRSTLIGSSEHKVTVQCKVDENHSLSSSDSKGGNVSIDGTTGEVNTSCDECEPVIATDAGTIHPSAVRTTNSGSVDLIEPQEFQHFCSDSDCTVNLNTAITYVGPEVCPESMAKMKMDNITHVQSLASESSHGSLEKDIPHRNKGNKVEADTFASDGQNAPIGIAFQSNDRKVELEKEAHLNSTRSVTSQMAKELEVESDEHVSNQIDETGGNYKGFISEDSSVQKEMVSSNDAKDSENTRQKSKRQCKKEAKAKKKEGKMKKKTKATDITGQKGLSKPTEEISQNSNEQQGLKEGEQKAAKGDKKGYRGKQGREEEESNEEEEDWEAIWDDHGECLNSEALSELSEIVDVQDMKLEKPKYDYLSFKPKDIVLESGMYDHVLEMYDFSPELKTPDLIHALAKFKGQSFDVKWVDDTHALAVFSNHKTAQLAIEQCSSPMLKLRSLYDGTHESKLMAKRSIDFLQPYKDRPMTSKLVANRLVTGALGMRSKMTKEERQLEREKIKAEREKKLTKEKQKKDLWDSDDLELK